MKFFDNIFKRGKKVAPEQRSSVFDYLTYNSSGSYTNSKALLLSTVYRCVETISDSVAALELEPYYIDKNGYKTKFTTHPTYYLLSREPNKKMSRFTFIKTLIISMLLKGNGYAYIQRDKKGDCIGLHFIHPDKVTVIEDPRTGEISYNIVGFRNKVESCNIIHILNFSYDGITGISTLQHARQTLGLSSDSETHAASFFKGGANLAGILKVHSALTGKQKQELKSAWTSAFNPSTGTPNSIAVLEGNMDFQSVSVNPADAQLLETRKFNVVDICRFFGVSPVKAFDLSNSSYSTVEATQLAFLTDTLTPILEKIELEFQRKLYKPSERNNITVRFDTSSLLRADKASLASYYNTLFNIGVVSANEIRKALDLPEVEGGDSHFVQVNLMELKKAAQNIPTNNQITNEDDTKNLQDE